MLGLGTGGRKTGALGLRGTGGLLTGGLTSVGLGRLGFGSDGLGSDGLGNSGFCALALWIVKVNGSNRATKVQNDDVRFDFMLFEDCQIVYQNRSEFGTF
jgi:hypothetical protein